VDVELRERASSELSFEGFFEREYRRLVRALFLLCGDRTEAEDTAQEALARTFERWDRIARMDSPTGYLYRIAFNLNSRRLRRQKAARALLHPLTAAEPDRTSEIDSRNDVLRTLLSLPPGLRAPMVLHELLELTSEEVGQILGLRAGSVRARLHRAREVFRERLGDDYA
jgi:RNA polymerase sigma factor (sigma-70 family)